MQMGNTQYPANKATQWRFPVSWKEHDALWVKKMLRSFLEQRCMFVCSENDLLVTALQYSSANSAETSGMCCFKRNCLSFSFCTLSVWHDHCTIKIILIIVFFFFFLFSHKMSLRICKLFHFGIQRQASKSTVVKKKAKYLNQLPFTLKSEPY